MHDTRRSKNELGAGVIDAAKELLPTNRMLPSAKRNIDASHIDEPAFKVSKGKKDNSPPNVFGLTLSACPRLAAKFAFKHPHLFKAQDVSSEVPQGEDAAAADRNPTNVESIHTLNPPVVLCVQQTVRKFRYPVRSLDPSGTVPPLNRSGSVRTEGSF